jgi:hypothetical protein
MMKLLLVGILALFPFMAWAETSSADKAGQLDQYPSAGPSAPNDPGIANLDDSAIDELSLFGNPYSPTSRTNFDGLTAFSKHDSDRLNSRSHEPEWLNDPLGRYGSPYSPDPMNQRYDVGNLYSPGGPMNLYMRGGRMERR